MDILGHLNVDKGVFILKELSNEEMMSINAGATVTGTLINAIYIGVNVFTDLGRYLGSSIRRIIDNNLCRY